MSAITSDTFAPPAAPPKRAPKPRRGGFNVRKLTVALAAYLIAMIFILPYAEMVITALRPKNELLSPGYLPKHWDFSNFTSIESPESSPRSTCHPSFGDAPLKRTVRPVHETVTEPATPDQVRSSVWAVAAGFGDDPPGFFVGALVGAVVAVRLGVREGVARADGE